MSTLSTGNGPGTSPWVKKFPGMRADNITLPAGSGGVIANGLFAIGAIFIAITFATGFMQVGGLGLKHALASFHVGAMTVLAICLGSIFFCLLFHLVNAGWVGTLRRQFENVASLIWIPILMIAVVLAISVLKKDSPDALFAWMGKDAVANSVLLARKSGYVNLPFFLIRAGIYVGIWLGLASFITSFSRNYDQTGDNAAAIRMRSRCAPAMLLFAFSMTFAAFDWLMGLDYSFFSTMWGVYYFSGCAFVSVTLVSMIHAVLRHTGKLEGVVTKEHFHDLGKLTFTFTCFWAYIAFFQYFLIWYANIPEETAYYIARKTDGWEKLFSLLMFGHFAAPFLVTIFRGVKKNPSAVIAVGCWLIFMEIADIFWIVRPIVYAGHQADQSTPGIATSWWLDGVGVMGPLLFFGSFLVRKVCSGTLVPLNDPRMREALNHKNYV